jgi:hypothetical protein
MVFLRLHMRLHLLRVSDPRTTLPRHNFLRAAVGTLAAASFTAATPARSPASTSDKLGAGDYVDLEQLHAPDQPVEIHRERRKLTLALRMRHGASTLLDGSGQDHCCSGPIRSAAFPPGQIKGAI